MVAGDRAGRHPLEHPAAAGAGAAAGALARRSSESDRARHAVVDLGDDAFTAGRPHPMIDPSVRLDLLAEQAADVDVAVVLMDVVLGHAVDPDPAASLAPAIRNAIGIAADGGRNLSVVIALCGTRGDPQDREAQADAFTSAGAWVFASNAAAARAAAALATGSGGPAALPWRGFRKQETPLQPPSPAPGPARIGGAVPELPVDVPAVICAGIDLLADALRGQAVDVGHGGLPAHCVPTPLTPDAVPAALADGAGRSAPAGGERAGGRADAGGSGAAGRRPAGRREALGLRPGEFCHAGPPIDFDRASGPLRGALIGAMIFEGLAADEADATAKLSAGEGISLGPCHDRHAVGPMAGVISPSMWLFELADEATGARAWCSLNEGLGQGAAVRRLLRRGDHPAALDGRRARAGAGHRGPRRRADRHHRDHRPDGADGRRGTQPQPGRDADVPPGDPAGADRLGPARRPTSPRWPGSSPATTTSSSTW